MRCSLVIVLIFALAGCDVPAQIVWSPDGTQAAYRAGNDAFLLNEQGTVLQPLGSSIGGFAWSRDSKTLYFAANDEDRNPPTALKLSWLGPAPDATTQPATASSEPKTVTVVSSLVDGKVTPLFRVADVMLWYLQLSPDGQWLAAMTSASKEDDNTQEFRLYAYAIHSGNLYEISRFCGLGACFTGPNEMAFAEAGGLDPVGLVHGHIVKVKLDDSSAALPRAVMLDAIMPLTKWMEPCKGGLLFCAAPRVFPALPTPESSQQMYKLYHYSFADGGLTVLADDVGELFESSPDGKRILLEKFTLPDPPATCPTTQEATLKPDPIRDDLCVMNANGSEPHILRSLSDYVGVPRPPMYPAWRGEDQITFIAPAEDAQSVNVDDHDRKVVDVIQYRLTDKGTLEALQPLSGDWKPEIKPYFHKDEVKN